jgi:hypothetical protein
MVLSACGRVKVAAVKARCIYMYIFTIDGCSDSARFETTL